MFTFLSKPFITVFCVMAVFLGAWSYHKSVLYSEVKIAVQEVHDAYDAQRQELERQAEEESANLRDKIQTLQKEKDNAIKSADYQRTAMRKWLYSIPTTRIRGDSTGDSNYPEDSSREVIGELSRKNADDLIEYSHDTEELKIHLVQCYKDYEAVKESIDTFGRK